MNDQYSQAQAIVNDFNNFRDQFEINRRKYFELQPIANMLPPLILKATRIINNILRMGKDYFISISVYLNKPKLENVNLQLTVIPRSNFLSTPLFHLLYANKQNRKTLKYFTHNELLIEINCINFIYAEGINTRQLHALLSLLGHNPTVFLSDYRGENAGRFAVDLSSTFKSNPLTSTQDRREQYYWSPIFINKPSLLPNTLWRHYVSQWSVSRLHGLIYKFFIGTGNIFLIPVHVDPKNAIALFSKRHGHSALTYHKISAGAGKNYTGTGLYNLGIKLFIKILEPAIKNKIIHSIHVISDKGLLTSNTISGDDKLTWQAQNIFKKLYK